MGGSGQDQYGEGMADSVDVVINDDPGLGYGFYGDCNTPLRNADNNYQYPCTGGAHDCAQLLSGCIWSTRNELIITEPADYLQILQSLTVNSIPMHTGSVITPQITIDFLTLDDDDANIDNGTPHYFEIDTGFGAHNMPAPPLNLLTFTYPNGRPDFVAPGGGTTMRVEVGSLSADPEPGTGLLHYSTGSGYTSIPMTEVSDNIYDAAFPAFTCGTTVNYYVSAETTSAQTATDPIDAPASAYATLSAYGLSVAFEDNFETDKGWTVVNENLTDGPWGRGVPVGGGDRGDPPTDYDGSGACYLTDNVDDNSDVDGGPTRLISPTFELLEGVDYRINYARWFYNDDHDIDRLDVHIHNGTSWVLVESVPHVDGWVYRTIDVSDYVTPPATIQMRFSATDNPNDSVTEAGIDAFSLVAVECEPPYEIGDLNCDGNIDGFDIDPFVLVMMSEPPYDDYYAAYPDCNHVLADINQDGDINGFDIDAFVALLQG
ncbi:MAG: hypothetical protein KKB50_13390 [Planctomycetes bacterium]|nr:hypothetical protein [Planctomycetota bacterium]